MKCVVFVASSHTPPVYINPSTHPLLSLSTTSLMAMAMAMAKEPLLRLRAAANEALAEYEPVALVLAPLLALLLARALHSALAVLHEKGIQGAVLGFLMSSAK